MGAGHSNPGPHALTSALPQHRLPARPQTADVGSLVTQYLLQMLRQGALPGDSLLWLVLKQEQPCIGYFLCCKETHRATDKRVTLAHGSAERKSQESITADTQDSESSHLHWEPARCGERAHVLKATPVAAFSSKALGPRPPRTSLWMVIFTQMALSSYLKGQEDMVYSANKFE